MRKNITRILDNYGRIRDVAEGLALATMVCIGLREWLKSMDTIQFILLLIFTISVIVIFITYITEWYRKRSVYYIPKLLQIMDEKIKFLIEVAPIPEDDTLEVLGRDIGEIWKVDVQKIKDAYELDDNTLAKREIIDVLDEIKGGLPELSDILTSLITMGGLLDSHNVGLISIKNNEYISLENKLDTLKKRTKKADIVKKVTTYTLTANGFYSLLLFYHYIQSESLVHEKFPAEFRAMISLVSSAIELQLSILLADIEESIRSKQNRDENK